MRAFLHRLLTATLALSLALSPAAGAWAGQESRTDLGELVGASGDSLLGIAPVAEGVAGILSPSAILDGFGDALVSGALSVAQNGGSFGQAVLGSFVSSLTSQAMAALQHGIGDLTLQGLAEGSLGHMALHGLVGCAFAEVSGGDCAAGFAAGAAQALYAGSLEGTGPVSDLQQQNRAQLLGAFVGFVLSSGEAVNVSLGGQVAQSAIANNRQLHREEIEWLRENATAFALEQGISYEEALRRLTLEAASRIDSRYADEGGDSEAAAFLDANKPQGYIASTIGNGNYEDQNQEWFAASYEQFHNHLINLATVISDTDIYYPLADFRAANGNGSVLGDPIIFITTRLTEGGAQYSLEDMSPQGQIAILELAKQNLQVVLEGDDYTAGQRYQMAVAFATTIFWALNSPDYEGATPEEIETLESFAGLAQAVQFELMPILLIEGSRLSDDIPPELVAARKNFLSSLSGTRYGPINPGPLPPHVAETFRSSSYTMIKTTETITLYRVSGGTASELGSYWTHIPPTGPLQSQLDLALDPAWGNAATTVTKIEVPAGTTIYQGYAASQTISGGTGLLLGGGSQVYIPQVDPSWISP